MKRVMGLAAVAIAMAMGGNTAQAEQELNIYSWSGTLPPDMVKKFETETGIKVSIDSFDSDDTLLAKLKQGGSYDIVSVTDSYIPIFVKEGLLQKAGVQDDPGMKNLDPRFKDQAWDPGNSYTVPYYWGTTSFAVDTDTYKGEIDSYKVLFDPPAELQGKINMFDAASEVVAMASIYLNVPLCSEDPKELAKVAELLKKQKPFVKSYSSQAGAIREALAAGELHMSTFWNGSTARTRAMRASIKYAFPEEGVLTWSENLAIPTAAKNPDNARKFMSFVLKPENIALMSNYLHYQNAVKGSAQYMDAALNSAPEMNIPSNRKPYFQTACSQAHTKLVDRLWTNLMK